MAMSLRAEEIARALGGATRAGNGFKCRCPAHADQNASMIVYDRPGGGVNVKCMANCEQGALVARLKQMDLWPAHVSRKPQDRVDNAKQRKGDGVIARIIQPVPRENEEPNWDGMRGPPPTVLYPYRDISGALLGYVARWDEIGRDKRVLPLSFAEKRDGTTGWVFKAPPDFTLYGLEQLAQRPDAPVLIVEGEKSADAGRRLFKDHLVLTFRGGAGAVAKNDFSPLHGRIVVGWPDADAPGHKAMAEVARRLAEVGAKEVRIVALPPGLPEHWDLADPVPAGVNLRQILLGAETAVVIENAPADEGKDFDLSPYVISADALLDMELEARDFIVEPFLTTHSLSMIYAERGLGKTWVSLTLALQLAMGNDFLGYSVNREWRVLYIDGEMPLADLQARVRSLAPSPPSNLMILSSEVLFRELRPINIQDAADRDAVDRLLAYLDGEGRSPDVIILDNLSSLSGGIDENDNSALDALLKWQTGLRHRGHAVVMVHHAGKNGTQRGASRREDLLDTSILLKRPGEDSEPHDGAHFVLVFAKTRGRKPKPEELELRLSEFKGQVDWLVNEVRNIDRALQMLRLIYETKPATQAELAKGLSITASAVSQQCSKLRRRNLIEAAPSLELTITGREVLVENFPDLETRLLKQGDLLHRDVL